MGHSGTMLQAPVPEGKFPGDEFAVFVPDPKFLVKMEVPQGRKEGDQVEFQLEDGRRIPIAIPPGKKAGDQFEAFVPPMPAPPTIELTVPDGCKAGDMVQFQDPNGQTMQVQVPEGKAPGQTFQVVLTQPQLPPDAVNPLMQELCAAAQSGDVEACKESVRKGANINDTFSVGFTPLFYAATYGKLDVAKFLIDHGAKVDVANKEGRTALHWAARNGHVQVAELLMDRGAPLGTRDGGNRTPLGVATDKQQHTMVKLLQSRGAPM